MSGCPHDPDVRTYLAVVARSSSGSSHGSPLRRFLFPLGVEGGDGGHAAEEDLGGDGDVEWPVMQLVMESWHRPLVRLMRRRLGATVLTSPRGSGPATVIVVVVLVLEIGVVVVVAAGDVVVVVVLVGAVLVVGVGAVLHVGLEVLVLLV